MAVYQITIDGEPSTKLVRAKNKAQAVKGKVDAKALSADEVADLVAKGATIEGADAAGDPAAD